MFDRAEACSAQKKNGWQSRKGVSIAEPTNGSKQKKNAWHSGKTARHSREVLGRAEKCLAEKKNNLAEQQCAYQRCIVLVGRRTCSQVAHARTGKITITHSWRQSSLSGVSSSVECGGGRHGSINSLHHF